VIPPSDGSADNTAMICASPSFICSAVGRCGPEGWPFGLYAVTGAAHWEVLLRVAPPSKPSVTYWRPNQGAHPVAVSLLGHSLPDESWGEISTSLRGKG